MKKIVLVTLGVLLFTAGFAQQKIDVQFPKGTIAGKSSGDISIQEIVNAGSILTTNETLKVVHIAITMNPGGPAIKECRGSGKLTAEMITFLKSLSTGTVFYFDGIEAANNVGDIIKLAPLKFTLK